MERLDMHEGEWPGVEVFVSAEGRSIWGLLPEDVYTALVQLNALLLEEEGHDVEYEEEE